MPQGFAGVKRIVDLNANTGAFIAILATTTSRRVIIDESQITAEGAANPPQGVIDYEIPNDGSTLGFTTVFRAVAGNGDIIGCGNLPIVIGNPMAGHEALGELVGQVGQPIIGVGTQAATTIIKLRSGSATATSVVITEFN